MANSAKLVPFILSYEGGWSCDPDDAGGATMKGITIATFTEFRKAKGRPAPTPADLKSISDQEWAEIFKANYWDPWKADQIRSQAIANILVDWGWCSGVRYVTKRIQSLLGLKPDGIVGPATLAAINAGSPQEWEYRFNRIKIMRGDFLLMASKNGRNAKYLNGWLRRWEAQHLRCLYDSRNIKITW